MTTIAIINHKGGTAKTTTASALAAWYNRLSPTNARATLIDLDPQANLSRRWNAIAERTNTTGDLIMRRTDLRHAAQTVAMAFDYADVVASDIRLEETAAAMQAKSPNHNFLRRAIHDNTGDNRTIIIDCPPAANILTINALVAADLVLVPVDPDDDAIAGLQRIQDMLRWLGQDMELPCGKLAGVIIVKANAVTVNHRLRAEAIRARWNVLATIPQIQNRNAATEILNAYEPVARKLFQNGGITC